MSRSRHYAVNDRPVLLLILPDGSLEPRAMDPVTGRMIADPGMLARLSSAAPFADVESLTEGAFEARLAEARAAASERRRRAPIAWEATGDGEFPYAAAHRGHSFVIRVNDFPAEPLYTLLSEGEEIEDLEDWPPAWIRPGRQGSSDANHSA